jgi:hypothetical protein
MAFSGALLGMYWRTPHMHLEHDPRPTREGIAISKDVWMFGIGTGLVLDAATESAHTARVQMTEHVKDTTEHVKDTAAANTAKTKASVRRARKSSVRRARKALARVT